MVVVPLMPVFTGQGQKDYRGFKSSLVYIAPSSQPAIRSGTLPHETKNK